MQNAAYLDKMSRIDIEKTDKNALIDIQTITIDTAMPIVPRMRAYLDQINNPYCFLCGETPVKIRFSDTGKTLDEAIESHFVGQKST